MKFKKPRGVLLGLGIGSMIVAALLFFLVPVIFNGAFQYNGLSAFVEGAKQLFSFNFSNVLYTALFVLLVMALAVMIVFGILLIQKKHKKHLITLLVSLILVAASYIFVSSYFLADVELNGMTGKLLDSMMKVDGQMGGKILSSVALAFVILSNILLIVHMFVCMVAMMVTDQMKKFEDEKAKELEEKLAAEQPAVQPKPVVVAAEKVPEEVAVEQAVENVDTVEDFEGRKLRETQFFKECIETGFFTEYEEIELPEPLEGVDEEPVCESSFVEEKSAFISRRSVHVGYTHD